MKDYATHKTFSDFERASCLAKYESAKNEFKIKTLDPNVSNSSYEQSYIDYRIALANKIKSDIKNLFSFLFII